MKTEAKFINRMIRFKESLGPEKLRMLQACCALSGLIILLFAYWPLMNKLNNAANSLDDIHAKLLNYQCAIAALDNSNVKNRLISQNVISMTITELTEKARSLGLQFSSIAQQSPQKTSQEGIMMLPISLTIESEYKTVGQFMAYIEDSSCGIIEVKYLSIRLKKGNLSKLSAKLILNLYVEI